MNNIYAHSPANDYALNTVEYMVKKKSDSGVILKRALIILATVILAFAGIIIIFKFPALAAFGAITIILVACFFKLVWGMTSYEYEYTIVQGEFSMDMIVGERKRKNLTSFLIRDAETVAPYNSTNLPEGATVIDASRSPYDEDTWCAVYRDEKGNLTALLFSAYNKALDIMSYYNRVAVSNERIKEEYSE